MSTPLVNTPSLAATTASDSDSKATKVLLVEDNESDALLVRTALAVLDDRQFYGSVFNIRTTGYLADAKARLSAEHFDVILLDLSLPDSKSHEETFFQLREHASGIPIIVLTGVDDEILGLGMVRHGAQDYLIKRQVEMAVAVRMACLDLLTAERLR